MSDSPSLGPYIVYCYSVDRSKTSLWNITHCAPHKYTLYQILLIESRGPNSRGVRMLHSGLIDIGKTYVPRLVITIVVSFLLNEQGVDLNISFPLHSSTPPYKMLGIMCFIATCEYQIVFIESRGPNSRGVRLLHVALADLAKTLVLQPGQPMVNLPLEATKHNYKFDGQFFCLYPTKCGKTYSYLHIIYNMFIKSNQICRYSRH